MGIVAFLLVTIFFSANVNAIRWRTVACGFGLQLLLAVVVLKLTIVGVRPGYAVFSALATVVTKFLEFTSAGAVFVFGVIADPQAMGSVFPNGFVLAFASLPIIIFVSSVCAVLYHLGVVQVVVGLMARAMMPVMGTSGAETLSAAANVFVGQTEAPLVVRPYVSRMTRSELLALMIGGLATIAGSMFAVYVGLGADPIAMLTTSVMAAPCGLYLAKILLPETELPDTSGDVTVKIEKEHVNVVDAAAAGAASGMHLALNVAAMLIAFLAFVAMLDFGLGVISPGMSLARVMAVVFAPVAALIGVGSADIPVVADLLGTKLVMNEMVSYVKLNGEYLGAISDRTHTLTSFALTGFANFGSIGVLLGGIGGMAPDRRADIASLSMRALLGGFVATLLNASIAALLL
jgi:CNT family concentrative nucleoside transporter